MKISAIRLKNFKGFKDEQIVDGLDEGLNKNQNVVLFGGLNGAGKTSFLEALYLCFYGRNAKNLYPTRGARLEEYHGFTLSLVNSEAKDKNPFHVSMSVEVFIKDLPMIGEVPRDVSFYRVWEFSRKSEAVEFKLSKDEFVILEDGKPLEEIDRENHEDRVTAILPITVAQFFFFDGEKIQDFAADADNEFNNSLRDVLGITMYSSLIQDLGTVRSRILTNFNKNKDSKAKVAEYSKTKADYETRIDTLEIEIGDCKRDLEKLVADATQLKNETFRITRVDAQSREDYEGELEKLKGKKAQVESELESMLREQFPFFLMAEDFAPIRSQLNSERQYRQHEATKRELQPKVDKIVNFVFEKTPPKDDIPYTAKKFYEDRVQKAIQHFVFDERGEEFEGFELIHDLTEQQEDLLLASLDEIERLLKGRINSALQDIRQVEIKLDTIDRTKKKSGDHNKEVQELFDRRDRVLADIGRKESDIQSKEDEIVRCKKEISICEREITNWGAKADLSEKHKAEINYCERSIEALKQFQKEYISQKKEDLQESISTMWNQLAHKNSWIDRVEVLPENNFEVRLYDHNNFEVDKTKMSAGEKEIYAISLLWALVQVSGRQLPIVIDTPFGKLDSMHRKSLLTNYIPRASHQVFLLSQDEEIIDEYYDLLKPSVAQERSIISKKGVSSFANGYPFHSNSATSV